MNDKKITSLREISDFIYSQNLKIENLTITLVCILISKFWLNIQIKLLKCEQWSDFIYKNLEIP